MRKADLYTHALYTRSCRSCAVQFSTKFLDEWLCAVCRRKRATAAARTHVCARCGETYSRCNPKQRECGECLKEEKLRSLKGPTEKPLPCLTCKHGRVTKEAELGAECVAGAWLRCRPLASATLYEAGGQHNV